MIGVAKKFAATGCANSARTAVGLEALDRIGQNQCHEDAAAAQPSTRPPTGQAELGRRESPRQCQAAQGLTEPNRLTGR
jgi:hypothetical protein